MTEKDEEEIDLKVRQLGQAMKDREISPQGFAALAAFTAFMGALMILGTTSEAATRIFTRIAIPGAALWYYWDVVIKFFTGNGQ